MKALIKLKDQYIKFSQGAINFDNHNQCAIIHHSDSIEGSTLTKGETYLLLKQMKKPKGFGMIL